MKILLRIASLIALLSALSTTPAFTQDEFDVLDDVVNIDESIGESPTEDTLDSADSILPEDPMPLIQETQELMVTDDAVSEPESDLPEPQEELVEVREKSSDEYVEIRTSHDIFLPYKQRQNPWGFSFSLGAEQVDFPNLVSQFDDNSFQSLFGSNGLTMLSAELGPKYNFSWGSLSMLLGYGHLSAKDSRIQVEAGLDITRYSATAVLQLDSFWDEPYFVPYFGLGAWQSDYAETSADQPGEVMRYSTEIGYHVRVGALFGLDWLEPATVLRARKQTGIKGVFVNVYASTSFMAEPSPDPDLENEYDLGASLVFEY